MFYLLQHKADEVADRKENLKKVEQLGAQMEEALILDNKYVMCSLCKGP